MLCTLALIEEQGQTQLIAISPANDVWFVDRKAFTPDLAKLTEATESTGKVSVVGAIFTGDKTT